MLPSTKIFEKLGFIRYDDSHFVIFEKKKENESFEQIKISRDTKLVQISSYIQEQDGYKVQPMIVNEEILKTVISAIKELKHDDIEKGELK
jgi:folate-dependent tRNA-U54 methylase TrmFO/GidA